MATASNQDNPGKVAAFTPGPWTVGWRTGMARAHYGHNVSCALHSTPGSVAGCCSIAEVRGHNDIEAEANARLIAAAPDLYAALKESIQWSPYKGESEETPFLRRARAAIRAVEGGAL